MTDDSAERGVSSRPWLAVSVAVVGAITAFATAAIAFVTVAEWVADGSGSPQQVAIPTPQVPTPQATPSGGTGANGSGPVLLVRYLVANLSEDPPVWRDYVEAKPGDWLQFYVEMHNTQIGTSASEATARSTFGEAQLGAVLSASSIVRFWAANASEVQAQVALTLEPPGRLWYVQDSTRLTWDRNGDDEKEYDDTKIPDGIAGSGIWIGNISGCNDFIAQISFLAHVTD
jgi:hypothetical protein